MRRPGSLLFLLALGAYAYFYQAGSWNTNTRFDLVRAIVERQTLQIDAYAGNTGDLARRDGHDYSDKAPGLSLLCVPLYAVVYAIDGAHREMDHFQTVASYLCVLWAVSLPAALAVVALWGALPALGVSRAWTALVVLGYAFATLAFPYATLFYGHQAAAAWILVAFAALVRARHVSGRPLTAPGAFGVGLALGLAVFIEYTAALSAAAVCLYAVATRPAGLRLRWTLAGVAIPVVVTLAYHWAAFGSPLALPYAFSTQHPRHEGAFMGIGAPTLRVLRFILVDEYRGLFFTAPWLLLAVPGILALARDRRTRAEPAIAAALPILYVLLNASLVDWHGGWAFGPRHLVAALPFLAIGVSGLGRQAPAEGEPAGRRRARSALLAVALAAVLWSAFLILVGTAVKPEVARAIERPFRDFLFPSFFEGRLAANTQSVDMVTGRGQSYRYAWNVGERLGLQGRLQLLPLGAYVFVMTTLWLRAAGRKRFEA